MSVTWISMSFNEADVATSWARHAWAQGATRCLVADGMSKDGTADLLRAEGVEVVEDHEPFCLQASIMTGLARDVGEGWIVPSDCDEYWCGTGGRTVADVLNGLPDDVGTVWALHYNHTDREHRWPEPRQLPKVAFRWSAGAQIAMGNHDVDGIPGGERSGLLEVRELQFRSLAHFKRKVADRIATLDPNRRAGDGAHYERLRGLTEAELDAEWALLQEHDTIWDPIPCA